MKNYIIGYGSLMNLSSLNRTLPTIENIEPIYLNGFKRSWNALENKNNSFSPTYLGVEIQVGARTNCIIFELSEEELETMDQREFLYTRKLVNMNDIECVQSTQISFSKEDKIWIYVTNNSSNPNKNYPIIQSYVDTCISGCLQLEIEFKMNNFAIDFIKSTDNWSKYWVNDRIFPRAPHVHQPYAFKIDNLLQSYMSELYQGIIIE